MLKRADLDEIDALLKESRQSSERTKAAAAKLADTHAKLQGLHHDVTGARDRTAVQMEQTQKGIQSLNSQMASCADAIDMLFATDSSTIPRLSIAMLIKDPNITSLRTFVGNKGLPYSSCLGHPRSPLLFCCCFRL